jgi:hypothetical protein
MTRGIISFETATKRTIGPIGVFSRVKEIQLSSNGPSSAVYPSILAGFPGISAPCFKSNSVVAIVVAADV